jgi:hypothetical protein
VRTVCSVVQSRSPVGLWALVARAPHGAAHLEVDVTLFGHRRVLEPSERIAEVLFGLIMVLTFTGSLSIAEVGRDDVRTMLIGALGCNFAWGVIDGVLYLMGALAERGRNLKTFQAVRVAADPAQAHALVGLTMALGG